MNECSVPSAWKSSIICPVPKKKSPSTLNDYRRVALASLVMKCFEKIVVQHLLTFTSQQLDPFHFAYKSHRGVDDAILTLLHKAFKHLDKPGSFTRVLFFDFSSAFNTIKPHILAEKLLCLNADPKFTLWIVHFLLNRTQSVRFQSVLLSQLCTSLAHHSAMFWPLFFFTLHTNDCRGTDITPVIKHSDDTAIGDLSNSDDVYFSAVRRFYTWCKENFLDLNVLKSKEMLIDFRRTLPLSRILRLMVKLLKEWMSINIWV